MLLGSAPDATLRPRYPSVDIPFSLDLPPLRLEGLTPEELNRVEERLRAEAIARAAGAAGAAAGPSTGATNR